MLDLISRQAAERAVDWDSEAYFATINLPTIDPVKHGTLIPYLITTNPPTYFFGCSLCNGAVEKNTKYCPHCGAMMERSEDERTD